MSRVASFWNLAPVPSIKTAGSNRIVSVPCFAVMSNSKMPRTGVAAHVPWTIDDFDNCVELVLRARKRQAFDDVMTRVRRIEEGLILRSYLLWVSPTATMSSVMRFLASRP